MPPQARLNGSRIRTGSSAGLPPASPAAAAGPIGAAGGRADGPQGPQAPRRGGRRGAQRRGAHPITRPKNRNYPRLPPAGAEGAELAMGERRGPLICTHAVERPPRGPGTGLSGSMRGDVAPLHRKGPVAASAGVLRWKWPWRGKGAGLRAREGVFAGLPCEWVYFRPYRERERHLKQPVGD